MGVYAGPDVAEDGLVLALDGGNLKSFKGSADTNLLYNISNTYGNPTDQTYFKVSYGDTEELIPELGYRTVRYCNIFNDYSGGSGQCCPSPLRYGGNVLGQSITVSSSTTYTYQIIYKVKSGYTNANYMYRYEYNGGTYVTEGGVHSTNNRTSLGNNWWFAWGQFTTQSTTNNLWLTGMWYYQYNVYDTIYIAGVSLHQGSHIIPAKFMLTPQENRGTTVATGGGWADLTGNGNHGELVNGVRENADNLGALSFDGVDDYITAGTLSGSFTSFTVIIWFYPTSVTNYENPIDCNYSYNGTTGNIGPRLEMNSNGNLTWAYSNITNSNSSYYVHQVVSSGLSANKWHCAAITYNGGTNTSTTYYNGNSTGLSRSTVGSPTGFVGVMNNVTIGKGFHLGGAERIFTGRVSNCSIYNRVLTASEIQQNFNANRSRFGI